MDIVEKTELVDDFIGEALRKLNDEYKGQIQLVAESDYGTGTIVIKVKG